MADPVEMGLARSLARPGGNVTGLSARLTPDIRAEQLQLLEEALPGLGRVAILRRTAVASAAVWREYEAAARALELTIQFFDVPGLEALERTFNAIARERVGALLVPGDPVFFTHRERVVALATEHRLPGIFSTREFTDAGGASPATLPIEQPVGFELVVNLKAARTLKVALPPAFLVRADEVIQ